jgi:hypothetical protein
MIRISGLSDAEVYLELSSKMRGESFSWSIISQCLRAQFRSKKLRLEHFEPGNILYEWNVLCDEKLHWQRLERPSFMSFKFNRDCLVKLKIIPTQAGLGMNGIYASTSP